MPSWLCATPSFLERHPVRTVEDLDKVPLLGCSLCIAPFLIAPGHGERTASSAGHSPRIH